MHVAACWCATLLSHPPTDAPTHPPVNVVLFVQVQHGLAGQLLDQAEAYGAAGQVRELVALTAEHGDARQRPMPRMPFDNSSAAPLHHCCCRKLEPLPARPAASNRWPPPSPPCRTAPPKVSAPSPPSLHIPFACSKLDHCLYDLLIRVENGEMENCTIPIILSNHPGAQRARRARHAQQAPVVHSACRFAPLEGSVVELVVIHRERERERGRAATTKPNGSVGGSAGLPELQSRRWCHVAAWPRRHCSPAVPASSPPIHRPPCSPSDLEVVAKRFNIPYRHLPITPKDAASKAAQVGPLVLPRRVVLVVSPPPPQQPQQQQRLVLEPNAGKMGRCALSPTTALSALRLLAAGGGDRGDSGGGGHQFDCVGAVHAGGALRKPVGCFAAVQGQRACGMHPRAAALLNDQTAGWAPPCAGRPLHIVLKKQPPASP